MDISNKHLVPEYLICECHLVTFNLCFALGPIKKIKRLHFMSETICKNETTSHIKPFYPLFI